ncbi:hypothetical protein ABIC08_009182 [Bradyrhizobium sp. RT9b]
MLKRRHEPVPRDWKDWKSLLARSAWSPCMPASGSEEARARATAFGGSVASAEGPDPGVRPPHHRLASIKCDEPAARCNPRRRAGAGNRAGGEHSRSQAFGSGGSSQPGSGSCRSISPVVARTGLAASASQAAAICAACSPLAHSPQSATPRSMAPDIGPGAGTDQGCRHRAPQQARQDGLGDDGQERPLPGTGLAGGLNRSFRRDRAGHSSVRQRTDGTNST